MQRLCKSNAMKLAPIAEMPPILSKDTLFPSHRQTSYMILTQTIRKLIYLFALIPNIIIKSPLYCSYICQKIRFLIENTKKIVENLQAISKLLNAPADIPSQRCCVTQSQFYCVSTPSQPLVGTGSAG